MSGGADPRVLIAHDFAETFGGAERICAEIGNVFGGSELWAILGREEVVARMGFAGRSHFLLPEREPLLRHYRGLAPLYPALVRARKLPAADVLLTSSYAFAHGFRTRNEAPQVCYCYSPLRFAWSLTEGYAAELPGGGRLAAAPLGLLARLMRAQDLKASRGVTRYVAESRFVAEQLREFYGREADVLWPPVDCEVFHPADPGHDEFFLFCGRLVEAYKRPSLAIEAFRDLGHRLVIAGDGPDLARLRRSAPPNVEFTGHLATRDLVPLMQRCSAAVFPSRDDFGLVPVEVMACGRPVLALAAGGALETVSPGVTGEFFTEQSVDAVRDAVLGFDPDAYDPSAIRAHAEGWRPDRFRRELRRIVREVADAG